MSITRNDKVTLMPAQRMDSRFKDKDGNINCGKYKSFNGCNSHKGACQWNGLVRKGECIRK